MDLEHRAHYHLSIADNYIESIEERQRIRQGGGVRPARSGTFDCPRDLRMAANHAMNSSRVVNIEDLRSLAQRRLPKSVFDYLDGGADDELT